MNVELPWVEKYRPGKLDEVVGQKQIVKRLKSYVEKKNVANQMYAGPAGTGKTSCAIALAKELYGEEFGRNFLELNASDARGIDVVRKEIKDFARTLAFDADFKIIFLDECDSMTSDAQHALRRTMEKYSKTARFVLSCNFSSKIIEPIQSRCIVFRFMPLESEELKGKVEEIAKEEGVKLDGKAVNAIEYVSGGDMRKAINVLQGSAMLGDEITDEVIYNVSSKAKPAEIREMIELVLKKKFLEARKLLQELMFKHGMSGEDILLQLYSETMEMDDKVLDSKAKIELINTIGEYNFRMVEGANEHIQLEALLAQYMKYAK